jgi:hypothetical protein
MFCRHLRLRRAIAVVATLAMLLTGGCGIINDNLLASFGGNAVNALPKPNGAIVILVMNLTSSAAVIRIQVTTQDGGTIDLSVPLDAFSAATELDHAMIVQECYVQSIVFNGGSIQSDTGGDPIEIPADLPPLTFGLNLFCGSLVAITIPGVGLAPIISVY